MRAEGRGILLAEHERVRWFACVLVCLSTGCLASRSGGVLFPTQNEVGMVTMTDGNAGGTGVRYSSALSWASVSPDPKTPVNVAVGYQVDQFAPGERQLEHGGTVPVPTVFHGPMLEIASRIGGSEHLRQWIGARLDMPMRHLGSASYIGVGAALRISAEWFTTVTDSNAIGALGVGAYLESGLRKIPGGDAAFIMSSGLSLRLPFAAVN